MPGKLQRGAPARHTVNDREETVAEELKSAVEELREDDALALVDRMLDEGADPSTSLTSPSGRWM